MNLKKIFTAVGMAAGASAAARAADPFVKGLDRCCTYVPATEGAAVKTVSWNGTDAQLLVLTYQGSVAVTLEKDGVHESIFSGAEEGEYLVAPWDFSNDGIPEVLVAVRSDDCFKVTVLARRDARWSVIGEMTTGGKGIREARVFRQALTMKNPSSGVLYTWTFHDGRFDFLSSDRRNDPADLL